MPPRYVLLKVLSSTPDAQMGITDDNLYYPTIDFKWYTPDETASLNRNINIVTNQAKQQIQSNLADRQRRLGSLQRAIRHMSREALHFRHTATEIAQREQCIDRCPCCCCCYNNGCCFNFFKYFACVGCEGCCGADFYEEGEYQASDIVL